MCELTLREGADTDIRAVATSASSRRASDLGLLPITLEEYLEVLDASGRIVREGKSGSIPDHLAPILKRLGVNASIWSELVTKFDEWFGHIVGSTKKLVERALATGRKWYRGQSHCASVFG